MPNLQSKLNEIAQNFVASVLDVVRGAPLQELVSSNGRDSGSRAMARGGAKAPSTGGAARPRSSGRLHRRSPEEIAKTLDQVVAAVRKSSEGLRAEQIRQELGLQAKEMPRILKEGLSKRVLRSKGQKRATTYFAK